MNWSHESKRSHHIGIVSAVLAAIILLAAAFPRTARAETRLYHLRVTLRSGVRYETISALDPINYCSLHGGSVVWRRDYSLIYSPEMKVYILRTWMYRAPDLASHWREVLLANDMLASNNHRFLTPLQPLSLAEMQRPE